MLIWDFGPSSSVGTPSMAASRCLGYRCLNASSFVVPGDGASLLARSLSPGHLKDEFYARVRARGHVPDNERKLRDDLTKALDRIKELIAEDNKLQGENDALARIVNVLNHKLRPGRSGRLVALPSAHDHQSNRPRTATRR